MNVSLVRLFSLHDSCLKCRPVDNVVEFGGKSNDFVFIFILKKSKQNVTFIWKNNGELYLKYFNLIFSPWEWLIYRIGTDATPSILRKCFKIIP